MAPAGAMSNFLFQSQGSQITFSDFAMKKQNQSGQIKKQLKWGTGCSEC